MKKILIPIAVAVTLLACSLTTPDIPLTIPPEVLPPEVIASELAPAQDILQGAIAYSPRELNLQPQDVPELVEVPVEQPASALLVKDAVDQNQRAYADPEKNVYIESSVVVMRGGGSGGGAEIEPEQLALGLAGLRNPETRQVKRGKLIPLGQGAFMVQLYGYCSREYKDGYLLVFHRDRAVVILFACGTDLTEDYLIRIARKVDGNLVRPTSDEELWIIQTAQAILATSTVVAATPGTPAADLDLPATLFYYGESTLTQGECSAGKPGYAILTINTDLTVTGMINGQEVSGTVTSIQWTVPAKDAYTLEQVYTYSLSSDYLVLTGTSLHNFWDQVNGNSTCTWSEEYDYAYQSK